MTAHPKPTASGQSPAHREAWAVLPFFVNRTLDPAARAAVETHLAGCVTCRAEVEMLRRVERGVRDAALETSQVDQAWHSLMAERATPKLGVRWPGVVAWLRDVISETPGPARLALASQAAFIVAALGALAVSGSATPEASYRTLSAASTALLPEAFLRVRFADEVTEARLRALLLEAELRIVDGPSAAGLYALAPTMRGAEPADAVTLLRAASDAVRVIEVLVSKSGSRGDAQRP